MRKMSGNEGSRMLDGGLMKAYITETREQIERLVLILLQLEQNPDRQLEFIDEMFRLAHNMKGSSGVIGLTEVKDVMHEVENLFSAVRNRQYLLDAHALDLLISLTDDFSSYLDENILTAPFPGEPWIQRLKKLMNGDSSVDINQKPDPPLVLSREEKDKVALWQEEGKVVYGIEMYFAPEAQLRSAASVIFLKFIRGCGEVLTISPSEEEIPEENYSALKIVLLRENRFTPEEESRIVAYPVNDGVEGVTIREWQYRRDENNGTYHSNGKNDKGYGAQTIRVESERIDKVINQLGKILTLKTGLLHLHREGYQGKQTWEKLSKILQDLDQTVSTLQSGAMDLRMIPVRQIFARFPKTVRDIAKQFGKKVELHFVGEDTEIDKQIAEELIDALTHLLRNSVDHGLEETKERISAGKDPAGHITLSARQEGSHIVISVSDDGRGLNLEKIKKKALSAGIIKEENNLSKDEIIRLIFAPGFSTADKVSEISGRGVGLDVVKTSLKKLQGDIDVLTEPGQGTTFALKVPLTLAIIQSFMVKVGGQVFGIPVTDVVQSIVIKEEEIHDVGDRRIFYRYPETIPLIDLGAHFRFPFHRDPNQIPVVIINCGRGRAGFIVEELIGLEEIMIKPINKALGEQNQISGAALLGSGKIALILNHQQIAQEAVNI